MTVGPSIIKELKDYRPFHYGSNIDAAITGFVALPNDTDAEETCTIC